MSKCHHLPTPIQIKGLEIQDYLWAAASCPKVTNEEKYLTDTYNPSSAKATTEWNR